MLEELSSVESGRWGAGAVPSTPGGPPQRGFGWTTAPPASPAVGSLRAMKMAVEVREVLCGRPGLAYWRVSRRARLSSLLSRFFFRRAAPTCPHPPSLFSSLLFRAKPLPASWTSSPPRKPTGPPCGPTAPPCSPPPGRARAWAASCLTRRRRTGRPLTARPRPPRRAVATALAPPARPCRPRPPRPPTRSARWWMTWRAWPPPAPGATRSRFDGRRLFSLSRRFCSVFCWRVRPGARLCTRRPAPAAPVPYPPPLPPLVWVCSILCVCVCMCASRELCGCVGARARGPAPRAHSCPLAAGGGPNTPPPFYPLPLPPSFFVDVRSPSESFL